MLRLACAQFTANHDIQRNLRICRTILQQAKEKKCHAVFFPEASDEIAPHSDTKTDSSQDLGSAEFLKQLHEDARRHDIVAFVGAHQLAPSSSLSCAASSTTNNESIEESGTSERSFNTYCVLDPQRPDSASSTVYKKIHLFDVDLSADGGPRLMESQWTVPGDQLVTCPLPVPDSEASVTVGLSICYDIRFPELAWSLRKNGADIITYPSAFTVETGRDHWQVLLRARAIETQCYVVAPAQVGHHYPGRRSWGESMIVDPWGRILAKCPSIDDLQPTTTATDSHYLCIATVNTEELTRIRRQMPVLRHRQSRPWQRDE